MCENQSRENNILNGPPGIGCILPTEGTPERLLDGLCSGGCLRT